MLYISKAYLKLYRSIDLELSNIVNLDNISPQYYNYI